MPAKAPLPPPEDELEAAEAVVATVVLVDAVGLADKEVVVVVELAADKFVDTVVELAADDEEAIGAVADFDVGVVMRQIPRAALPPHIELGFPEHAKRHDVSGKTYAEAEMLVVDMKH